MVVKDEDSGRAFSPDSHGDDDESGDEEERDEPDMTLIEFLNWLMFPKFCTFLL
jgi:hypothetical protein